MPSSIDPRAPIVCSHCGRDYAHSYWASFGTLEHPNPTVRGDPFLCFSCRRDTNPDAADAPRWVAPVPKTHAVVRSVAVSQSRKRCRMCGCEWDGLIFGPAATKGSDLPYGICDACADAEERHIREMSARTVSATAPIPEMRRPRRVLGLDD